MNESDLEEITRPPGNIPRGSFALRCYRRGGQVFLIVPGENFPIDAGITYYKPVEGWLPFRVGKNATRKLSKSSPTSLSGISNIPASVAKILRAEKGTHAVTVEDMGGGLYRMKLPEEK